MSNAVAVKSSNAVRVSTGRDAQSVSCSNADNRRLELAPTDPNRETSVAISLTPCKIATTALEKGAELMIVTPDGSEEDGNTTILKNRVIELYKDQQRLALRMKRSRAEIKQTTIELSEKLFELKAVYCKPGSQGRWGHILDELSIPRAAADRYVFQHDQRLLLLSDHSTIGEMIEPTADMVRAFVKRNAPKFRAVLTTSAAVEQFLEEIAVELRAA